MKVNWYNKSNGKNSNFVTITKNGIYFPLDVVKNHHLFDYSVANVGINDAGEIVVRFGNSRLNNTTNFKVIQRKLNQNTASVLIGCTKFIRENNLTDFDNKYKHYENRMHIVDKDTIYMLLNRG